MVIVNDLWTKILENKTLINSMYIVLNVEPGKANAEAILKKKELHKPEIAEYVIKFMKQLKNVTEYMEQSAKEIEKLQEQIVEEKNTVITLQKEIIKKNGSQTDKFNKIIDEKIQGALKS